MRTSVLLVILVSLFAIGNINAQCCESEKPSCKSESLSTSKSASLITVYYFHGERRCATCIAVGTVSENYVAKNYSNNKKVCFKEVDLSLPENSELGKKYSIASSGLVVCNGTTSKDITALAFQYARNNPEKLEAELGKLIAEQLK